LGVGQFLLEGTELLISSIGHHCYGRRELVLLCRLGIQFPYPGKPQVRDVALGACVISKSRWFGGLNFHQALLIQSWRLKNSHVI
jgi:hypothetical protein